MLLPIADDILILAVLLGELVSARPTRGGHADTGVVPQILEIGIAAKILAAVLLLNVARGRCGLVARGLAARCGGSRRCLAALRGGRGAISSSLYGGRGG